MNAFGAALSLAVWAALVGAACKEQQQPPPVPEDAMRMRRFFQPPPGEVRAVPPHAIHADGVGPYVMGRSLRDVLGMLSRGPRVMLVQIDGVVDYSLVRAESGALIIGVEPLGGVVFVSVLDAETARTESGIGVGTDSAELAELLGPPLTGPDLAMPSGMVGFASLPNVRFLLDEPGGRVAAVVVRRPRTVAPGVAGAVPPESQVPEAAPAAPPASLPATSGARDAGVRAIGMAACQQGGELATRVEEIARAAGVTRAEAERSLRFGCFSGAAAEALVHAGDRVIVVGSTPGAEAGPLRRLASHSAPGISFAAPLDVDDDGRSDLALVKLAQIDGERRVEVELLRLEGARFTPLAAGEVYRLSERNATWVGANLGGIELLVELRALGGDVVTGGLYVHRGPNGLDTVAPLLPALVEVPRRRQSPAGVAPEAAVGRQRPPTRTDLNVAAQPEGASPALLGPATDDAPGDAPGEVPDDAPDPEHAPPPPDAGPQQ